MGEVVELDVQTTQDIPSEKLLQKAIEAGITNVVILGYDKDGEFWFASSDADRRNGDREREEARTESYRDDTDDYTEEDCARDEQVDNDTRDAKLGAI